MTNQKFALLTLKHFQRLHAEAKDQHKLKSNPYWAGRMHSLAVASYYVRSLCRRQKIKLPRRQGEV